MMRRAIALARDYAYRRKVFGKLLAEQPLHLHTLASLEVEYRGCLLLCMHLYRLAGSYTYLTMHLTDEELKNNIKVQTEGHLFRILAPLLKLYVCKVGVSVISEAMECLGGIDFQREKNTILPKTVIKKNIIISYHKSDVRY
jgi:alkylation response protein AidB-like acyl-CoA dehydrogenase